MPKISIIIPCYNQSQYLGEAIRSVLAQNGIDFEIIVIDDGSEVPLCSRVVCELADVRVKLFRINNSGLSSARNTGISKALGEYILPLDADDRLATGYLEKAAKILDEQSAVGIVYGEAEFFGERAGCWKLPVFSATGMLLENAIFCSAMFRKDAWTNSAGYNPNMKYGMEDQDFWLTLLESGVKVVKIPETVFYYRVKNDSMVVKLDSNNVNMRAQLFRNHQQLYVDNIEVLFEEYNRLKQRLALYEIAFGWLKRPLEGLMDFLNRHSRLKYWLKRKFQR